MDRKDSSKKDQIILQQLEVIRTMTENNLSRMGTDFWGSPAIPETDAAPGQDPDTGAGKSARAAGTAEKTAGEEAAPPPNPISMAGPPKTINFAPGSI